MAEYTNQTCMGANATCATTTLKANETGEAMAYVLGCVEDPHNCTSYDTELCNNVTTTASAVNITIKTCHTQCCSTSLCNADFVPTEPPSEPVSTATGTTMEATTATAQVFRPELIAMLLIVFIAVFFGLQ